MSSILGAIRTLVFGLLAVVILGDALGVEAEPWQNWEAQLHVGDPLVGRSWSTRDQQVVDPDKLADDLAEAQFVYTDTSSFWGLL
jgi:hypothetical protein